MGSKKRLFDRLFVTLHHPAKTKAYSNLNHPVAAIKKESSSREHTLSAVTRLSVNFY